MNTQNMIKPCTDLLSRLIACPSVNPNNRPFDGPPFGEEQFAALLRELLESWGAEVKIQDVLPRRPNLIARFRGKDPSRSLMLDAHSDTVQVSDMTIPPFEPRLDGGRLYGRGACDDKGPMASILLGIRDVLERDGQPPTDVYFVATCGEERGCAGATALMESGFRTDAAIVSEPTDLNIVHAHKGALRWRIRTHGLPAHSSAPQMGLNAIMLMARFVNEIHGPLTETLSRRSHPLLGQPTVSVGSIHGGLQVNTVPSECVIEVDRRVLPSESREAATAEVKAALEETLRRTEPRFRFSCEPIEWYPPMEIATDDPLTQMVEAACKKVMGRAEFAVAPWGANSGLFCEAGIPSVLFGPGSIRQAHTADEFIEIEQVAAAVGVYAEIIRNFR